jgi:hypothetical protein
VMGITTDAICVCLPSDTRFSASLKQRNISAGRSSWGHTLASTRRLQFVLQLKHPITDHAGLEQGFINLWSADHQWYVKIF